MSFQPNVLRATKYIPDIVKLMKLLQEILNQREDKEAIEKLTIKDFISQIVLKGIFSNIVEIFLIVRICQGRELTCSKLHSMSNQLATYVLLYYS